MKRRMIVPALILVTGLASAQRAPLSTTDLRLRRGGVPATDSPAFRYVGGVLRSYDGEGVETGSWDAETGFITADVEIGEIPAENITAGALGTDVIVQDGSLSANIPRKDSTAEQVFSGDVHAPVLRTTVTSPGAAGQIQFGPTGAAGTLTLLTLPSPRFLFNVPIAGDGSLLINLNASNLGSGTVPDARLGSNIPRLETGNMGSIGFSGSVIASTLEGNGAAISDLNASNLDSGTVPNARLSSQVAKYTDSAANFQSYTLGVGTGSTEFGIVGEVVFGEGNSYGTGRITYNSDIGQFEFIGGEVSATNFVGNGANLVGIPKFNTENTWTEPQKVSGGLLNANGQTLSDGVSLNASALSGTLPVASLPSQAARKDQANTWTNTNTWTQSGVNRLRVHSAGVDVIGSFKLTGTFVTTQRETTSNTTWDLTSDGILYVHMSGSSGDVTITLPPDGTGVNVGSVLKIYVITSHATNKLYLSSPTGAYFRARTGSGSGTYEIPAIMGNYVELTKAYTEWRLTQNF